MKIALAYSGGLDTSVCVRWLKEHYKAKVVCVYVDMGQGGNARTVRKKAKASGAVKVCISDLKDEFVREFVFPALKANAVYEGKYYLATALSRPLIARELVKVARREGCNAVAHGSTGKGNDQVRFEVGVSTLAPHLKIIAPLREWELSSREEEIEYARKHRIPVTVTKRSPYSVDENLWGRSIECGVLEDPWTEPPEEVYKLTKSAKGAPVKPAYVQVHFKKGVPTAINGKNLSPVSLIGKLNKLGGNHGVGRVDMVENRLVGIKSREVYECPAAVILHTAHRALEDMVLDRETSHYKELLARKYSELIYYGLWYTPLKESIDAFVDATQGGVTGKVRVKLWKGTCTVVGRKSPFSLYSYKMATYEKGSTFDEGLAEGFISLWGLPYKIRTMTKKGKGKKR